MSESITGDVWNIFDPIAIVRWPGLAVLGRSKGRGLRIVFSAASTHI